MRAVLYVEFQGEPEKLEKIREEIDSNTGCCLSANDVVGDTLVIGGETKGYIPVLIRDLAEKYGCIYGFEHERISKNMCETYDPHGILPGYWANDCLMDQRDWHMCETGVAMSWDEALAEVNARGGEYTMEDICRAVFETTDGSDEYGTTRYIKLIRSDKLTEEEIDWEV